MFCRTPKIESQKFRPQLLIESLADRLKTLSATDQALTVSLIDRKALSTERRRPATRLGDQLVHDRFRPVLGQQFPGDDPSFRIFSL